MVVEEMSLRQETRSSPANKKHLYTICTMLHQRRRCWAGVVQIIYESFVFAGSGPPLTLYCKVKHESLPWFHKDSRLFMTHNYYVIFYGVFLLYRSGLVIPLNYMWPYVQPLTPPPYATYIGPTLRCLIQFT